MSFYVVLIFKFFPKFGHNHRFFTTAVTGSIHFVIITTTTTTTGCHNFLNRRFYAIYGILAFNRKVSRLLI